MKTKRSLQGQLAALLAMVSLLAISSPVTLMAQGGPIKRLSAEFKNFDFTESFTTLGIATCPDGGTRPDLCVAGPPGSDGAVQYTKTVLTDLDVNVLYVTISAVGDTHFGSAEWLSCRVDGNFCNPGQGGADDAPPGWIGVKKMYNYNTTYTTPDGETLSAGDGGGGTGDSHDHGIHYTWCTPISPGTHTVEIRQATSHAGDPNNVFFEAAHFYIDASSTPKGCTATASP